MNMQKLRKKIDTVDEQILRLLNERTEAVLKIGKIKATKGEQFYVPNREKAIITNLLKKNKGPLPKEALKEIFREILTTSLSLQKKLKIAYFGPEATFTHLAAIKNFGNQADFIPVKSIADVFEEVENDRADYGVVPIENSTEGIINHTLDMFIDSDLTICSEIMMKISQNLISREKDISKISKIYSHPQPIAQSRNWIEDNLPNAQLFEVASTSVASGLVSKTSGSAAIASKLAASLFKLNILASNIEDKADNMTRFLVIGRSFPETSGDDKTSILFSIKDRVGGLYDMLIPFKKNGINLTKIESRPSKRKAWEYIFFVDFIGHVKNQKVKKALDELAGKCQYLKVLGSYPKS
jgi:chorismate mutase / prephenate dehydratase